MLLSFVLQINHLFHTAHCFGSLFIASFNTATFIQSLTNVGIQRPLNILSTPVSSAYQPLSVTKSGNEFSSNQKTLLLLPISVLRLEYSTQFCFLTRSVVFPVHREYAASFGQKNHPLIACLHHTLYINVCNDWAGCQLSTADTTTFEFPSKRTFITLYECQFSDLVIVVVVAVESV